MAVPYYNVGTATLTTGSADVVGQDTLWLGNIRPGDQLVSYAGETAIVGAVVDNTHITLARPFRGTAQAAAAYEIVYTPDDPFTQQLARKVLQAISGSALVGLGDLEAIAQTIPYFDETGTAALITRQDLTSGVQTDARVNTLADRAAYNAQPAGFSVFVANIGDGRSAIYAKNSNTSADWSAPAYITGPVGPSGTITSATATRLAPGAAPTVTLGGTPSQRTIALGIPAGRGFNFRGAYSGATAYVLDDVVRDNGSSWIALQATTGHAPPIYPTTSNAYWELVALKGIDGTGTGDVVGPSSAVNNASVVMDGTTGKLVKANPYSTTVTDWNTAVTSGPFRSNPGSANCPAALAANYINGSVLMDGTTEGLQTVWQAGNAAVKYERNFNSSTWGAWRKTSLPDSPFGFRNKIINGNFDIWQRGTTLSGAGFLADRFKLASTGQTSAQSRIAFTPGATGNPPGCGQFYHRTVITGAGSASAYVYFDHNLENLRNFAGKKHTFTFWVSTDAGKPVAAEFVMLFGSGGSPTSPTVVTADTIKFVGTDGSWRKCQTTVTIPSLSGYTLGTNDDSYLTARVFYSAGSNFDARTGAIGVQTGSFNLSGPISFVEGDATGEDDPFSPRHIQQELALCQRYYETGGAILLTTSSGATASAFTVPFAVPKRTVPTVARTANYYTSAEVGTSAAGASATGFNFSNSGAAAGGYWTADAEF